MQEKNRQLRFLENFSEFIFQEDRPEPVDIIFIPGNGYPQMAERAASLWKQGYAPWILPSGKYSILAEGFSGVLSRQERYNGNYQTEWEFLKEVLVTNGVPADVILKEEEASYTYQNAIFSRDVTDREGIDVRRGIICCKAQHARRCRMYYQLLYPEAELLICPADTGINKGNWYRTEEGVREVLGEVKRCGSQFHEIFRELLEQQEKK